MEVYYAWLLTFLLFKDMALAKVRLPMASEITNMKEATRSAFQREPNFKTVAVRLGLHDCAGGCNGCVNLDDANNAGLAEIVRELEWLYWRQGFDGLVNHADFWALATTVAVEEGMKKAKMGCNENKDCQRPPCMDFFWGREECMNAPLSKAINLIPSPDMTFEAMFSYFNQQFGFSPKEVVALMGAHNLGKASSFNSGFEGTWKHLPDEVFVLNSDFYRIMIDASITWENVDAALKANFTGQGHKWQWEGFDQNPQEHPHMFFNTDFYVFFNITLDEQGKATCSLDTQCGLYGTCGLDGTCGKSPTYEIALAYSQDEDLFLHDFAQVWTKLWQTGYSGLESTPNPDCQY